jgi:hypothetical protein
MESKQPKTAPEEHLATEFEPKKLTPWQNVVLTIKVLGTVALVTLVMWLMQRGKS